MLLNSPPPPERIVTTVPERWLAALAPEYRSDINVVLTYDGNVDAARLSRALRTVIADEPMWGYRFVEHWRLPYWQRLTAAELRDLVHVQSVDDVAESLEALSQTTPSFACRAHILRTATGDTVCFRIDHRLADGQAARQLIQQIQRHYHEDVAEPAGDFLATLVRRTMALLRPRATIRQRWQMLKANGPFAARMRRSAFRIPPPTADDPVAPTRQIRFGADLSETLIQRAMRARATVPMLIQAAACRAVREVLSLPADCAVPLAMPVDLRRYLAADQAEAPAVCLIGLAVVWAEGPRSDTISDILSQLREQFAAQRGPTFGLQNSYLAFDIPVLREALHYWPYAGMRRRWRQRFFGPGHRPLVTVSDLGSFGEVGDLWGDRQVIGSDCPLSPMGLSGLWIGVSTCQGELMLSITGGAGSFLNAVVDRLHANLCQFAGQSADSSTHLGIGGPHVYSFANARQQDRRRLASSPE